MPPLHTPLTRRNILHLLAASAASAAVGVVHPNALFAQNQARSPGVHFGVQLNAFPINPGKFEIFTIALDQVKQTGYEGFEAGYRFLPSNFPLQRRRARRSKPRA